MRPRHRHPLGLFVVGLLLAAVMPLPLSAQDSQEALIQRRDEFLKEEFLTKAKWITDYDQALKAAKETGKPIFAYFTRSYAP